MAYATAHRLWTDDSQLTLLSPKGMDPLAGHRLGRGRVIRVKENRPTQYDPQDPRNGKINSHGDPRFSLRSTSLLTGFSIVRENCLKY
jgi:hypothetical protein